jgi:hypothetical protein
MTEAWQKKRGKKMRRQADVGANRGKKARGSRNPRQGIVDPCSRLGKLSDSTTRELNLSWPSTNKLKLTPAPNWSKLLYSMILSEHEVERKLATDNARDTQRSKIAG